MNCLSGCSASASRSLTRPDEDISRDCQVAGGINVTVAVAVAVDVETVVSIGKIVAVSAGTTVNV